MSTYGKDRSWPFAQGGEGTIGVITAVWLASIAHHKQQKNNISTFLLAFATFLWLMILYFFRDPNRTPTTGDGLVVGPGDGEVVEISYEYEDRYLHTDVVRISMFLSVLDVHVQRVPIGGVVTAVDHQPGQYLQAFKPEASQLNEYIGMVIDTPYGPVLTKQIAGILARRCVNYMEVGQTVETGHRFGLIRFSSRVDLFLPPTAQLLVTVGDKVTGGITPMATLRGSHDNQ